MLTFLLQFNTFDFAKNLALNNNNNNNNNNQICKAPECQKTSALTEHTGEVIDCFMSSSILSRRGDIVRVNFTKCKSAFSISCCLNHSCKTFFTFYKKKFQ